MVFFCRFCGEKFRFKGELYSHLKEDHFMEMFSTRRSLRERIIF